MQPEKKAPPPVSGMPFMTAWYGPRALTQTGIRDFVSRVIGQYADQRVLQAAVDRPYLAQLVARYDYSDPLAAPEQVLPADADGAVWVDYVSDSGDGFEPTYSIARLLTLPALELEGAGRKLPSGNLLIMGGDQAYPYGSIEDYQKRLIQPFNLTSWHAELGPADVRKSVFVLPGNHDWYDGLSAFDRIFCSRRNGISAGTTFGPYQCRQHRSYWAIQLPHDWWIWGLDVQLTASLDVGQMQYFAAISDSFKDFSETLPRAKSRNKIILCIATPSWLEGDQAGTFEAYSENLRQILNLAIDNATVCCVISGDWHHYCRYFNNDHRLNLITSGGGGAYLAPTHQLKSVIKVPWQLATDEAPRLLDFRLNAPSSTTDEAVANATMQARPEAVYPPRRTSRLLSWLVPAFPIWNPTFCLALGTLYFLMYWFYTSALNITPFCLGMSTQERPFCPARPRERIPMDDILIGAKEVLTPFEHFYYLFDASRWQPFLAITVLLVFGLIYQFLAGFKSGWKRIVESAVFWLLHVFLMAYMADAVLSWAAASDALGKSGWLRILATSTIMWIVGGGLAGLMCGIYLFIGNRVLHTHHDNAFSSIRIAGYKNFLRLRITKDDLTIYPIGLDRVPTRAGWRHPTAAERAAGEVAAYVPRFGLKPHLIEGPIHIRPADIVQMIPSGAEDRATKVT